MKKHLALLLALVMVLGSFSFVSAAPDFPDVKDTTFEEAVGSLELLDILKGYPDGTFKPANTITRAEFAAVAVRVSGLEQAAMSAKGLPTGFSDVPAWHWASGYVGTAGKLGIVNGIGGGLFAPESPVKYEEAITMIVRALGYEPAAQAKGGYPFGYLIVANEIDLLDGALGTQGTWATRGFVAQITFNALEIPMMIQSGYGTDSRFVVSGTDGTDEKYLIEQMGFKSVEGRVNDYDKDDLEIEIAVEKENNVELDEKDFYDKTYEVVEGFDFYRVHGVTVKAWVSGGKVLLTKLVDKVMFDATEFDAVDDDELYLVTADKDYKIEGKAFYFNNDLEKFKDTDFNADYAKVVMDGNKVVWADGVDFDEFVVFNKVSGKYLVDFNDDEYDVKDYLMVKDGKTVSADALEAGDVVFLYNNDYFDYDGLGVVATNMKEGVVTKAYDKSFRLDGDLYELATDAQYLDNKEQGVVDSKILADFEDEAEKITVVLDFKGDAALMYGTRGIGSTLGAILTKQAKTFASRSEIKVAWDLVNELGEEVSFDGDTDETTTGAIIAYQWDVVEYVLDKDGDLDDIDILDIAGDETDDEGALETDDKYAAGFRLTSNTVVFLVDDGDEEVDEVFLWKDAKDFFSKATEYDVYEEDGDVTYLVVYDSDAGDEEAGIVVDTRKISNTKTEYKINIEGKEYRLDHNTEEGIKIGSIVVFDINEKMDEIKNLKLAPFIEGEVKNIKTGTRILDIGGNTYNLTRNAVIFDVKEDDVINLRDLEAGSMVKAYEDSARFVSYIVVEDVEDPEPATGWELIYNGGQTVYVKVPSDLDPEIEDDVYAIVLGTSVEFGDATALVKVVGEFNISATFAPPAITNTIFTANLVKTSAPTVVLASKTFVGNVD